MQQLLRKPLLAVADSDRMEGLVRRHAGGLVHRFVAGEDLESAVAAVRGIATRGCPPPSTSSARTSRRSRRPRRPPTPTSAILERLAAEGLEPNISIKLTMLGLDLGDRSPLAC